MYHANSASGYGGSLNLNVSIERENRHLETGLIMQLGSAKISGGEIIYRQYLSSVYNNGNTWYGQSRNVRLYFQYNLVYRQHLLPETEMLMPASIIETTIPGRRIPTIEHYIGVGTIIKTFDHLFINTSIGYGIIMGSIDDKHFSGQNYSIYDTRCDYGLSIKLGLSYFFRM